jgi:transposase
LRREWWRSRLAEPRTTGAALRALGHEVRLIPAACVKPLVKRNKTDARDAPAICVAARRADMRAVAIKSEEQQASRALEQSRELLVKQRTQPMNSLRAMRAEFGIVDRTKAVGDGRQFACGRAFTSWMGMTPRENSSAGKRRTEG